MLYFIKKKCIFIKKKLLLLLSRMKLIIAFNCDLPRINWNKFKIQCRLTIYDRIANTQT